ncbi:hypothetical protein LSAT2_006558, partial [Lamellibrachia satsuma]
RQYVHACARHRSLAWRRHKATTDACAQRGACLMDSPTNYRLISSIFHAAFRRAAKQDRPPHATWVSNHPRRQGVHRTHPPHPSLCSPTETQALTMHANGAFPGDHVGVSINPDSLQY